MNAPRPLGLYLRSRGVPVTVPGLAALVVVLGWDARWLDWMSAPAALALAGVAAASLLAGGFGSPDPELDATAAVPWWRVRAGHAAAGTAACVLALAAAVHLHETGGAGLDPTMARDMLGLAGIALVAAAVVGSRLAWAAPLAALLLAVTIPPMAPETMRTLPTEGQGGPPVWSVLVHWPLQPTDVAPTWWVAAGLCTIGVSALTVYGERTPA